MTSFVRKLARSISVVDESSLPSAPRAEPLMHARSLPRQLSTSPSFNDFSLHVGDDVMHELGKTDWVPSETLTPAGSMTASGASSPTAVTPKVPIPKRKIVGMDPYDFCDFLKSSSL